MNTQQPVNHELIDNYLGGVTTTDLPDIEALSANTVAAIERTAAIKQVLALVSDDAKAQAELSEAEAVLHSVTHQPVGLEVAIPENVPVSSALTPRVSWVAFAVVALVLVGIGVIIS